MAMGELHAASIIHVINMTMMMMNITQHHVVLRSHSRHKFKYKSLIYTRARLPPLHWVVTWVDIV
jgi:hypothetical protein